MSWALTATDCCFPVDVDAIVTPNLEEQLVHIHRLVERRVDGIILRLADDAAPEKVPPQTNVTLISKHYTSVR